MTIQQAIVHQVPVRRKTGTGTAAPLLLSDAVSPLDASVRAFFKSQVSGAVGAGARAVEQDPLSPSPVPGTVVTYLQNASADFVKTSRLLADHLYQVQTGVNPGGLLCCLDVTLDGDRTLVIVKVEEETGLRAHLKTAGGGKGRTFDLTLLKDILFTKKTRVFKVAIFTAAGARSGTLTGTAVDPQKAGPGVARFFLNDYLGCRLREQPDVTTARFFDAVQSYANDVTDDESTRTTLTLALLAEMQGPSPVVNPTDFAARTVVLDDRDGFLTHLADKGVPRQPFDKDDALVRNRLAKVRIDFAQGAVLLAPPEQIDGPEPTVTLGVADDGRTSAQIVDRVVRTRSSGRGSSSNPRAAPPRAQPGAQA